MPIEVTENINEIIMSLAINWYKHPYEINNGDCEDFAYAVKKVIPEVEVYWGNEIVDNFDFFTKDHDTEYHAFMYYKGKYYDAEEPYGVDNPAHLPYFERNLRANKNKDKKIYPAPNREPQFAPEPVFNFVVRSWEL